MERRGFEGFAGDWAKPYEQVFYANVVLEGLEKVLPANHAELEKHGHIKGGALFLRALAFYHLVQLFAAPYDGTTASQMPGVPLRLSPVVTEKSVRPSIQDTYDRIFLDLDEAYGLLPEKGAFPSRPSKLAVDALLSRIYLSIEDYEKAGAYATRALEMHPGLLDYNTLDLALNNPFTPFNPEVIYHVQLLNYSFGTSPLTIVGPDIYGAYQTGDLRQSAFYTVRQGLPNFTGNYTGSSRLFGGLATDELYLNRAECRARSGDVEGAMEDLNGLLVTRWEDGTFVPLEAATAEQALALVLGERRKGLLFRGLRWPDLRRLNKDPRFAKTLAREINGETYTLPPNGPRYVFPIPPEEIELGGLEQNPRN